MPQASRQKPFRPAGVDGAAAGALADQADERGAVVTGRPFVDLLTGLPRPHCVQAGSQIAEAVHIGGGESIYRRFACGQVQSSCPQAKRAILPRDLGRRRWNI